MDLYFWAAPAERFLVGNAVTRLEFARASPRGDPGICFGGSREKPESQLFRPDVFSPVPPSVSCVSVHALAEGQRSSWWWHIIPLYTNLSARMKREPYSTPDLVAVRVATGHPRLNWRKSAYPSPESSGSALNLLEWNSLSSLLPLSLVFIFHLGISTFPHSLLPRACTLFPPPPTPVIRGESQ